MNAKSQSRTEESEGPILGPGEITARMQAALNLVNAAKAMGFLDRVKLVLSKISGRVGGDATDSPRPEERRQDQWRGQEQGSTESLGPIGTERTDGESSWSDQMGDEMWRRFREKEKPKKPQKQHEGGSREG